MSLFDALFILGAVVAFISLIWLGLEFLTRWCEGRCRQRLAQIVSVLETLNEGIQQAEREGRRFLPGDPPPYGSTARELHQTLEQIRISHVSQMQQLARLPPESFPESHILLGVVWNGFSSRPRYHKQRHNEVEALWQSAQQLEGQVDYVRNLLDELQHKPWDVALRCRDLLRTIQENLKMALALTAIGLESTTLESTTETLERIESLLRELPGYFLNGTHQQVMAEATKQSTIDTWQALNNSKAQARPYLEQIGRWSSLYRKLGEYLTGSYDLLRQITDEMDEARSLAEYRIIWRESEIELNRLCGLQANIGGIEARRTSGQLSKDLAEAKKLGAWSRALASKVAGAREWREKLAPLLRRPDIVQQQSWMEQARDLDKTIADYAWGWSADREVQGVLEDAKRLAKRHKRLTAPYLNKPLPEGVLNEQFVNGVQALTSDLERFQQRLQQIDAQLKALQHQEQAAQQTLDIYLANLDTVLRQVEQLSGELRSRPRVADTRRGVIKLQEEGNRLRARLRKRNANQISNIAGDVEKWAKNCPDHLERLSRDLQKEVEDLGWQLQDDVQSLIDMATFSREPAMKTADELLKSRCTFDRPQAKKADQNALEPFVAWACQLLDRLVALERSLAALQEQIGEPVRDRYQTLDLQREQATANLRFLEESAMDAGPDVARQITRIRSIIREADRDLADLRKGGETLDQVRHQLNNLTERYESAATEAAQRAAELQG